MPIWHSSNIYYYNSWKQLFCLIFLWKQKVLCTDSPLSILVLELTTSHHSGPTSPSHTANASLTTHNSFCLICSSTYHQYDGEVEWTFLDLIRGHFCGLMSVNVSCTKTGLTEYNSCLWSLILITDLFSYLTLKTFTFRVTTWRVTFS